MKQLVNKALSKLDLKLIKNSYFSSSESEKSVYYSLLKANIANVNGDNTKMDCIIFSMDRAIQLNALLESIDFHVKNIGKIFVLYRTTSQDYKKAYSDVIELYKNENIEFLEEGKTTFKINLLNLLDKVRTDKLFFLVDDIVFTESADLTEAASFDTRDFVVSLRHGDNITYSYVHNKKLVKPELNKTFTNEKYIAWDYKKITGESDWEYPISVDGHIFGSKEITVMIANTDFRSPNTLEPNLYKFGDLFKNRIGIAYRKSKLVNIPANKVQTESNNKNLHGNVHQDDLLKKWNEGYKIDIQVLKGFMNKGTHEEVDYTFVKKS